MVLIKSITIGLILVLALLVSPVSAWYSSYEYKQIHNITGSTGWTTGAQTNYPILIRANRGYGISTGNMIYTNGSTNTSWNDIRFTNTTDSPYNYYIESGYNASFANIWVNVTSIANDTPTQIYIYYNKSNDTTTNSDGESTFTFFDDFDAATYNSTKWNTPSVTASFTGGFLKYTMTVTKWGFLPSKLAYSAPYRLIGRMNASGMSSSVPFGYSIHMSKGTSFTGNDSTNGYRVDESDTATYGVNIQKFTGSWTNLNQTAYTLSADTMYKGVVYTTESGTTINHTYYSDDYSARLVSGTTTDTTYTSGNITTLSSSTSGTHYAYYDFVMLAKYPTNGVEPVDGMWYEPESSTPQAPDASFTMNTTSGYISVPVQFTDTSTHTPTSWVWNFTNTTGNNTPVTFSTSKNPVETFGAGIWKIQLNATNAAGSNLSAEQTLTVSATSPPVASFTMNTTSGAISVPVQFNDTSLYTPTSWVWNFTNTTGNNTPVTFSTSQDPVETFGAGIWHIQLNATNAEGSNLSAEQTLTVSATKIPVASFTMNTTSGAISVPVQFNDTSLYTPTSWVWNFTNTTGNNTPVTFSTSQDPVETFGVGVWHIQLNATNIEGSNLSEEQTLTVSNTAPPAASFTMNTTSGVNIVPVQFNDTSAYLPTSWVWNFTNTTGNNTPVTFSTSQDPVETFGVGIWHIQLNATNAEGSNLSAEQTLTVSYGSGLSGYNQQNVILDQLFILNASFACVTNHSPIQIVKVTNEKGISQNTTNAIYYGTYGFGEIAILTSEADGYVPSVSSYVVTSNRNVTIYLTPSTASTPETAIGYIHQIYYMAHLVRLRGVDYRGVPIDEMNVTAVGVETSGSWSWLTDVFGINLNETPIHNTTMGGQTGDDGAIVFLMAENIKYNITFTKPSLSISESHRLYPKEDSYEYVFWTETPPAYSSSLIYIDIWNQTNQSDPLYMDLFATYTDSGSTTDNLTFTVRRTGNETLFTEHSSTPNSWNISYPVLKERGKSYLWEISGNTTRFEYRVGKSKIISFEGSPIVPTDFGEWNQWVALVIIFVVATLFGRASIKYAAVIVPSLTLLFAVIGFMGVPSILMSVILFLGVMFYIRYAEQESDI